MSGAAPNGGPRALAASSWDGHRRTALRVGVALLAARELHGLAASLWDARAVTAPSLLLALGGRPLAIVAVAFVGAAALLQLARGRGPLVAGALALLILAFFAESQSALLGGPRRQSFAAGAVLLGWLAGLGWGRALGPRPREDLAEAGAVATLAATYVAAATSKLLASGLGWADDTTLRGVLLMQQRSDAHGPLATYAAFVIAHPGLSQALAAATLVIQLGAALMLVGPRLRMLWGVLLIGFHVNVALLTGIRYTGNVWLLLLLALPWPRWLRLARETTP